MPGYGQLSISPLLYKRDWPIARHFLFPTSLCHTYSEPSWHEDSPGTPVHGPKMHPEMPGNKYFSTLGYCGSISPPPYLVWEKSCSEDDAKSAEKVEENVVSQLLISKQPFIGSKVLEAKVQLGASQIVRYKYWKFTFSSILHNKMRYCHFNIKVFLEFKGQKLFRTIVIMARQFWEPDRYRYE